MTNERCMCIKQDEHGESACEDVGCEIDQTFYKAAYSRIFDNPPPQPLEEFLPFMGNQKVD